MADQNLDFCMQMNGTWAIGPFSWPIKILDQKYSCSKRSSKILIFFLTREETDFVEDWHLKKHTFSFALSLFSASVFGWKKAFYLHTGKCIC